jgi:DNA-binding Lrp family transcriptional regulator
MRRTKDMITAYILAKLETGKEEEVFKHLKGLPEVKKAAATLGTYDMVIETSFETMEELDEFIFMKLRRIVGIVETVSMITSKAIV